MPRLRDAMAHPLRPDAPLSLALFALTERSALQRFHVCRFDFALNALAACIREDSRAPETLARCGDSLALLMPDTALDDAQARAEKLAAAFNARPLTFDRAHLPATARASVLEWNRTDSAADFLRAAKQGDA